MKGIDELTASSPLSLGISALDVRHEENEKNLEIQVDTPARLVGHARTPLVR